MLCGSCEEHFGHESDRSAGYLRLKTRVVSLARESLDDPVLLKNLELNLRRYQQAVYLNRDTTLKMPCPWYHGDLPDVSWQLPESFKDKCFVEVWKTPRQGRDVRFSALAGCELCQRLCVIVSHMPEFCHILTVRFESRLHFDPVSLKPSHIRILAQRPFHHEWLYLWIVEDQAGSFGDIKFRCPTGHFSGDVGCLTFLSKSLETCVRDHPSCQPRNTENWIPTRLLDVRQKMTAPDSVRLVERDSVRAEHGGKGIPYTTLSHVWGDGEFFTLTKNNLEDMKGGIVLSSLPQCFQDAIKMTRQLRVRYLWIDSMCIKQDAESSEDWTAEAATMDKVYEYGLCNFAACTSTSPGEGFFRERDAGVGGPFSLEWEWLDHTARFVVFFDWFDTITRYSPLYRRGWVVQERLISPRTMHFSTFPFWECHEMVTCEAYPSEIYAQKFQWLSLPEKGITRDGESPEKTWLRIIEHYSNCDLTYARDKLIALCGVAKMFSPSIGGHYLAGLWSTNLLQGLLWQVKKHVSGSDVATERPLEYVAPSWSWASIDGPICSRCNEISQSFAKIGAARTESINQNPFGQLTGGELTIQGVLFETPFLWALFDPQPYGSSPHFDDWALSFDDLATIDSEDITDTYFLPLVQSPDASKETNLTICGIFIQRVKSLRRQSVFKRVGFAIVDEDDGCIANTGWFLKQWKSPPWPNESETINII